VAWLSFCENKFQTGFDQPLLCGMYVDRRLAGIQAVQTLSRLNRAHPGKDTTYILDFVNSSEEILAAFRQYFETAEIEAETDPNLVYDLRQKLDGQGYYDQFEVDRLVAVELNPHATQGQLISAIEPVAQRMLSLFRVAQAKFQEANAAGNKTAAGDAKEEMDALLQARGDMGAFICARTCCRNRHARSSAPTTVRASIRVRAVTVTSPTLPSG